MLLNEYTTINISNKNKKYYIKTGYDIKKFGKYVIKTKDLSSGSHVKVNVKCVHCNNIKNVRYYDYYKITTNNTEDYYCKNCKHIRTQNTIFKKYGINNVFQSEEIKNKIKETNSKLYGVDYPMQNKIIQEKTIKTNLKVRGVKYPTQSENVIKKQKETNLKLYGNTFSLKNKDIIEKSNKTKLELYGTINVSESKTIQDKKIKTRLYSLSTNYDKYEFVNNEDGFYHIKCDNNCEHIFKITPDLFRNRVKQHTILCNICNPLNSYSTSGMELELQNYIKSIYSGEISLNNRELIKPFEIDIYIKEKNIAFEFNGVFWHNELNKPRYYHKNKTDLLLEKNIQLIHIWEDDWVHKKELLKSLIKSKFDLIDGKIYARNCKIKTITENKTYHNFLEENHIQGYAQASIKIGLYFNNNLVSLMSFSKIKKSSKSKNIYDTNCELIRYSNKLNMTVVGGEIKLFNHFISHYKPTTILSYSNKDTSTENLYNILGFKKIGEAEPTYQYIIDGIRKHRFNFRKILLIKQGFDINKSEKEIMYERNYYRIYNSGYFIFEMKL
jgi:hypothetical protein